MREPDENDNETISIHNFAVDQREPTREYGPQTSTTTRHTKKRRATQSWTITNVPTQTQYTTSISTQTEHKTHTNSAAQTTHKTYTDSYTQTDIKKEHIDQEKDEPPKKRKRYEDNLKAEGVIRISVHGIEQYSDNELNCILNRMGAKWSGKVGQKPTDGCSKNGLIHTCQPNRPGL